MQSALNLKIKYRESFLPFAPSVLREQVEDWFEFVTDSPYMLLVADVVESRRRKMTAEEEALWGINKLKVQRSEIPAVTHVDYSARIQTVRREENPLSLLIGEGLLLGIGVCAATLAMLPWSRTWLVPALLIIAAIAAWRSAGGSPAGPPAARWRWEIAFYAFALIALIGYALYATVAAPPEFDYLTNWGFKAKAFFEVRAIDWQLLGRTIDRNVHPDYPLLLPLTYDFIAVLRDSWSDSFLGIVHVAFATALLLVIHGTALEETRSRIAAAFRIQPGRFRHGTSGHPALLQKSLRKSRGNPDQQNRGSAPVCL